jgi:hypothetical protein
MLVCNNSLIGSAVLLILIHSVCNLLPFYICTLYIERNHSIRKVYDTIYDVRYYQKPASNLDHNTNCVIHNVRWTCSPRRHLDLDLR